MYFASIQDKSDVIGSDGCKCPSLAWRTRFTAVGHLSSLDACKYQVFILIIQVCI